MVHLHTIISVSISTFQNLIKRILSTANILLASIHLYYGVIRQSFAIKEPSHKRSLEFMTYDTLIIIINYISSICEFAKVNVKIYDFIYIN